MFWQACGVVTILTEAGLPSCEYSQDAKDNIGVISAVADGNTAWGARGDAGQFGEGELFPDGAQVMANS